MGKDTQERNMDAMWPRDGLRWERPGWEGVGGWARKVQSYSGRSQQDHVF